jgi:hexosaminidase
MIWVILTSFFLLSYGMNIVPSVWPMPKEFNVGNNSIYISSKFQFQLLQTEKNEVKTLSNAFLRYSQLMFQEISENVLPASSISFLTQLSVKVENLSEDYPQLETDESYQISINENGEGEITAKTIYGALHALETFSQLVIFNYDEGCYHLVGIPIAIIDSPRYSHRGLLLDTSRHFQPLTELKRTIDALSYAKYNVLHWHIVDTQSFPFESLTYPNLWNGSYTIVERYRQSDIISIVEYGRERGVKIMIEFDIPGHAGSWCSGYPEICPSSTCLEPLDPSSDLTFQVIESLMKECTTPTATRQAMFPYSLFHLGGDEVEYWCWSSSPHVLAWAKEQGYNSTEDIYKYFLDRAAQLARSYGRTPVQWVEVFEHFGE